MNQAERLSAEIDPDRGLAQVQITVIRSILFVLVSFVVVLRIALKTTTNGKSKRPCDNSGEFSDLCHCIS